MVAVPVLKLWAVVLIYKVVAAVIQPIVDRQVVEAISGLRQSHACPCSPGYRRSDVFLIITVVVGLGNLTAVMREDMAYLREWLKPSLHS